ncbi:hypothetical protein VNO80_14856 [Phaseolus coccineus]|uniref:Uncharacterized protein n=1 Tax=Phaseolus coccineus TaxID=3886 RepID=A0AAN9R1S7_PHACN
MGGVCVAVNELATVNEHVVGEEPATGADQVGSTDDGSEGSEMATGTQERDEEDTSESETNDEGSFDKVIQSEMTPKMKNQKRKEEMMNTKRTSSILKFCKI